MPGIKGQRSGGVNAKSPAEHRALGTFQPVRHAGFEAPDPFVGTPESPEPLEGRAAAEWDRMLERLADCKTLAKVDAAAIYQYCRLYAETEALAELQSETGASVKILEENLAGLKGPDLVACFQEISKLRQLEARYVTQIRQGRMAQKAYLVEFGLTPASRSRVRIPTRDKEPSKLAAFMRQPVKVAG